MQAKRNEGMELYMGMNLPDGGVERILTNGILSPGRFYFGETWPQIFKEYFGVDISTASLKEIVFASHRNGDAIESFTTACPGGNWFPRASFSETPEEAKKFAREKGGCVIRAVVPRRLLAPSIEEVGPRHVAAPYFDEYGKRTEGEWISVGEIFPAKYIAGVVKLEEGVYIPSGREEHKGYDSRDLMRRCGIMPRAVRNNNLNTRPLS